MECGGTAVTAHQIAGNQTAVFAAGIAALVIAVGSNERGAAGQQELARPDQDIVQGDGTDLIIHKQNNKNVRQPPRTLQALIGLALQRCVNVYVATKWEGRAFPRPRALTIPNGMDFCATR